MNKISNATRIGGKSAAQVSSAAMFRLLSLFGIFCLLPLAVKSEAQAPVNSYRVVHAYPHDPETSTQGLVFVDGHLYESTGRNGMSSLRMVDLSIGRVLQKHNLPAEYFGEGLTDWAAT